MGFLTVISETGMFHSAVLLQRDAGDDGRWYGFKPNVNKMPMWSGHVDRSDRTDFVNHYARFAVENPLLDDAERVIDETYARGFYAIGVKDCVSLSADVAEACGLSVAIANFTPYGLLIYLKVNNAYTAFDTRPFPW